MSKLSQEYPILSMDSLDFEDGIVYSVDAGTRNRKIVVTHHLRGDSVIAYLVRNNMASFCCTLKYKRNSLRISCDAFEITRDEKGIISAENVIDTLSISESPEIWPCIIIQDNFNPFKNKDIKNNLGLSDFWQGFTFEYPDKARIATHDPLVFESNDLNSLISVEKNKNMNKGSLKVIVNYYDDHSSYPFTVKCATDVFNALRKITRELTKESLTFEESLHASIITMVLASAYYQIKLHLNIDPEYQPTGRIESHLETLENKTGYNWKDEQFRPDEAASMMYRFYTTPRRVGS